jgi:aquaporin Z
MQGAALNLSAARENTPWTAALRSHWPEYFMEAAALGAFMISACVCSVLLEHPSSPIHQSLADLPIVRQALMGLAMGSTLIAIVYSPWGQRSGAHMNPGVTITYFALGKVTAPDSLFYMLSQFLGGVAGVMIAGMLIGLPLQHSAVNFVVTTPGSGGVRIAFAAEFAISFLMMSTVLWASNSRRLSRFTPLFAGTLVATFIFVESPLSGMSMNPARTFGSAFSADEWTALWIYFTAPPAAMLLASLVYRFRNGANAVFCAKLHHCNNQRCIFKCRYGDLDAQ